MKKYFFKETDEVLEYGDVVLLSFEKELEDGCVTCEKEVKFVEGMEEFLLDMGIIEEREDDDTLIDFDDCPHEDLLQELCDGQDVLLQRIKKLEEIVNILKADKEKAKTASKK